MKQRIISIIVMAVLAVYEYKWVSLFFELCAEANPECQAAILVGKIFGGAFCFILALINLAFPE